MPQLKYHIAWISLIVILCFSGTSAFARETSVPQTTQDILAARKQLFQNVSAVTGIPWYVLAAIDQYERTITIARPKQRQKRNGLIGIHYTSEEWRGLLNPNPDDSNPATLRFFYGMGQDGDGDGKAELANDADVLYTRALSILEHGTAKDDFQNGLLSYYKTDRSVLRIFQFAKLYAAYDSLDLLKHSFPLPLRSDYSYRSTWGAKRGWGGRRIHEGTDIFAGYGVPVRSTSYGIVEEIGWNKFGGWRIGIRDIQNIYHYYAHLSGFHKPLDEGDIVEPGQVIGWVGSSGYGKPGTQGKFPPHLHYGLYRDAGKTEWSFDPYPQLRKWEREEASRSKRK